MPGRTEPRASPARNKRILIVDDNETVLEILEEFLSSAYLVDGARNAALALKALTSNPPDVILLDVNMPGTDGLTLLKSLRELGVAVPIFIITGYDSPGLAEKVTRSRATAYLVKPVDLRRLDRLIASALQVPPFVTD